MSTIGSMFSGMGALDLAVAQVLDAEPAWFCEWEDAPSKVLAHHWPAVPNYRDVTTVDWGQVPRVDILTGGTPCQDLSHAGKRAGMTEGTRSNLWVNMREAIAVLKPRLVVWENVLGALSAAATSDSDMEPGTGLLGGGNGHLRALGRVLGDLAEIGFDAAWTTVRASDVGAPHHRARVFLIATPADTQGGGIVTVHDRPRCPSARGSGDGWTDRGYRREDAPDPHGVGVEAGGQPQPGPPQQPRVDDRERALPDSIRTGRIERRGTAPGQAESGRAHGEPDRCGDGVRWGPYAPAVRRWERLTRPAPAPTELNRNNKPRLNAAFAEWMMGLPAGHVTQVPGLSRADQLRILGNGVVPQQGAAALRELLRVPAPSTEKTRT